METLVYEVSIVMSKERGKISVLKRKDVSLHTYTYGLGLGSYRPMLFLSIMSVKQSVRT